jgi:hypothetical protein
MTFLRDATKYKPLNIVESATTKYVMLSVSVAKQRDTKNVAIIIIVTIINDRKLGTEGSASRRMLFFNITFLMYIGMAKAFTTNVSSNIVTRFTTFISCNDNIAMPHIRKPCTVNTLT